VMKVRHLYLWAKAPPYPKAPPLLELGQRWLKVSGALQSVASEVGPKESESGSSGSDSQLELPLHCYPPRRTDVSVASPVGHT
jgi:hypothetical protein